MRPAQSPHQPAAAPATAQAASARVLGPGAALCLMRRPAATPREAMEREGAALALPPLGAAQVRALDGS